MLEVLIPVLSSAILKFFAHPNFIFTEGVGFLAWFYYVPFLYYLPKYKTYHKTLTAGFLYGFLSYALFCNWLLTYNFWAGLAVYILYGLYWTAIFAVIKVFTKTYRYSFIFNVFILFISEFLFTKGYLGFSYGVSGYTQWKVDCFLRAARYTKIWGITFLLCFSNALMAEIIDPLLRSKKWNFLQYSGIVFFTLLTLQHILVGGYAVTADSKGVLKVALIQNNNDPWAEGFAQYKKEVDELKELTDKALLEHPETELVIWPETAVVVDVVNYFISKTEPKREGMARDLFNYINSKDCRFLIGNNYLDKNSALLMSASELSHVENKTVIPDYQVYSKNHLVPFSEDFPLKYLLAPLYIKMLTAGNVFWDAGKKINLLNCGSVKIGSPICFEDTFSDIPAKMAEKGADIFVNLSNDSWSNSTACQYQHLAVSCFRSVENGLPQVRATTSGQTCYINGEGKVVSMLEPFTKDYLYCEVELNRLR
jgi:apolipoprotein N-acyltransferase